MGALLIVAVLAAFIYYLLRIAPPVAASAASPADASVPFTGPAWLAGRTRYVLLFAASLIVAWIVVNGALSVWLGFTAAIGRPLGLGSGPVTVIVLAPIAVALYRYRARAIPKAKAFAQKVRDAMETPVSAPTPGPESVTESAAAPSMDEPAADAQAIPEPAAVVGEEHDITDASAATTGCSLRENNSDARR